MEWQAIGLDQAKLYYDLHLTRDFPPEEMKPFSVITELWQKGQYEAWGCFDPAGRLQAYAYLFWPEGGNTPCWTITPFCRNTGPPAWAG